MVAVAVTDLHLDAGTFGTAVLRGAVRTAEVSALVLDFDASGRAIAARRSATHRIVGGGGVILVRLRITRPVRVLGRDRVSGLTERGTVARDRALPASGNARFVGRRVREQRDRQDGEELHQEPHGFLLSLLGVSF